MTEDINKGMQKIGDDDLFSVSGGMSGEGLHTDAESFYRGLGNAFFSGIEGRRGPGECPALQVMKRETPAGQDLAPLCRSALSAER